MGQARQHGKRQRVLQREDSIGRRSVVAHIVNDDGQPRPGSWDLRTRSRMLRQDVNRVGWRTIVAIEELDIPIPRGAAGRIARQFVRGRYTVERLQEVRQTRAVRLAGLARQHRHIKVIGRAVIGRGLARGRPYAPVL